MFYKMIDKIVTSRMDKVQTEIEEKLDLKVSEKISKLEKSINIKFNGVDEGIQSVKDLRDLTDKKLNSLREKLVGIALKIKKALD